jgi:hypothetical protein
MKIKHILFILCFFVASFVCIGCSTDGSTNENLVEKTWFTDDNGNYSRATWSFTFAECEKISDTEFNVIYETRLLFYTEIPSTSTKRYQTAKLAREKCSKWTYYSKKGLTTSNNGIKFYRNKIKECRYAVIR